VIDTRQIPEDEKPLIVRRLWHKYARPEQQLPPGEWRTAWISGGRGSGKTRAGAEIAADLALLDTSLDGAIIAPTFGDARKKCIEGESGILRALAGHVTKYNRSEGIIYLDGGGTIFPDGADDGAYRIQGENLAWAWCDEVGLWRVGYWETAWHESIQFAVRKGAGRIVVTGTPKAGHPLVKLLNSDPTVPKVRMRTFDNRANLSPAVIDYLKDRYEGTRLGRQELEGEVIDEVEGALWSRELIEASRLTHTGEFARVVVAVDPPGGATEAGIVTAGLSKGDCTCGNRENLPHVYVLADDSLLPSGPDEWGRETVTAFNRWTADRVVAEVNYGGDMVKNVIHGVQPSTPYKSVTATRGKRVRAEPVAALYEQGRVHHVGAFPQLEDEMSQWTQDDDWSPNRLDALVWAVTELAPWQGRRRTGVMDLTTGLGG
jgi:phage terminase large subunit-like protein